jgi:hypothetical protein
MIRASPNDLTLPEESEVRAAVHGQRELAAYLATKFETQRIQIVDEKNVTHQIELPTSALRLLVDILAELAEGNAVRARSDRRQVCRRRREDTSDPRRHRQHCGVARTIAGNKPLLAVIGGLDLFNASDQTLVWTGAKLQSNPRSDYTCD